jgi:hypothetical protein
MEKEKNFVPYFVLGLVNEDTPACSQIDSVSIDPAILAGLCVSLIDSVISKLPDEKQIEFEEQTAKLISYMIDNRHEYVSTISNNEGE